MIGIATTRERTIHAGALVKIDARNQADPVCMDPKVLDKGGRACLDEENVEVRDPHPGRPDRRAARRPSVATASRRRCPTAASSSRGPTAPSTISPSSRSRRRTSASTSSTRSRRRTSSSTTTATTWELNAIAVAPRAEPPVIGDLVSTNQRPRHAGPHRLGRHHEDEPRRTRSRARKFGDRASRSPRRSSRR